MEHTREACSRTDERNLAHCNQRTRVLITTKPCFDVTDKFLDVITHKCYYVGNLTSYDRTYNENVALKLNFALS